MILKSWLPTSKVFHFRGNLRHPTLNDVGLCRLNSWQQINTPTGIFLQDVYIYIYPDAQCMVYLYIPRSIECQGCMVLQVVILVALLAIPICGSVPCSKVFQKLYFVESDTCYFHSYKKTTHEKYQFFQGATGSPPHPKKIINWVVVSNMFYFHLYLGKIPILTNIFQMGWNHLSVTSVRHLVFRPVFFSSEKNISSRQKNLRSQLFPQVERGIDSLRTDVQEMLQVNGKTTSCDQWVHPGWLDYFGGWYGWWFRNPAKQLIW